MTELLRNSSGSLDNNTQLSPYKRTNTQYCKVLEECHLALRFGGELCCILVSYPDYSIKVLELLGEASCAGREPSPL